MKKTMVRLAMIGIGSTLCFGVTACGKEEAASTAEAKLLTTEAKPMAAEAASAADAESATAEAQPLEELMKNWKLVQFTVKGETTKAEELPSYDLENMAPRFTCEDGIHIVFSNGAKDHPGTVSLENGQYILRYDDTTRDMTATLSGDRLTVVNDKGTLEIIFRVGEEADGPAEEEHVPLVEQWDDSIVERYVASYVVSEEETLEMLKAIGKDSAEYFSGTDYKFDVVMDLKEDGTAVLYYDFEEWIQILKDNLSVKFNDLMIAKYEEDGVSKEELEKQMTAIGFRDLDQMLDSMKISVMEELDPMLREQLKVITDIRIEMTWSKEGDTLILNNGNGIEIGADGSFDYHLPKNQSITGAEYDLHFEPVAR